MTIQRIYSKNGFLAATVPYKNGIVDGIVECFYPNGQLSATTKVIDGKIEGLRVLYYSTGFKKEEANYKNDVIDGEQKFFDEDGSLSMIRYYTKGIWDLKETVFDKNIRKEYTFLDDSKTGICKCYKSGNLCYTHKLLHGTIVESYKISRERIVPSFNCCCAIVLKETGNEYLTKDEQEKLSSIIQRNCEDAEWQQILIQFVTRLNNGIFDNKIYSECLSNIQNLAPTLGPVYYKGEKDAWTRTL